MAFMGVVTRMEIIVADIDRVFDGGELVGQKFLHVSTDILFNILAAIFYTFHTTCFACVDRVTHPSGTAVIMAFMGVVTRMEIIVADIDRVFDGGELVSQKFLHVGWKDATKSGVGGGYASKGNNSGGKLHL
mmetsp:Transcript_2835/g.4155  ORF Transcript_2835/g.4155 Transcript_2835/m.4155 type:complete len:132 (+) Transcript_2835:268-663(+)